MTADEQPDGQEHLTELLGVVHVPLPFEDGPGATEPRDPRGHSAPSLTLLHDQDAGQEFSMKVKTSSLLAPVIQSVMPCQKLPAPTAPGMRSEASNR